MYQEYNPNPAGRRVGDCVVRALSMATGQTWERTYIDLCIEGLVRSDMPNADHVWGSYLRRIGFKRHALPDSCPDCYTVEDFCKDHPTGSYVLAIGGHVVAAKDGNFLDSWNSANEVPAYYWQREE